MTTKQRRNKGIVGSLELATKFPHKTEEGLQVVEEGGVLMIWGPW